MNTEQPRILFVDDDANLLGGIRNNLRRRYRVATALGGEEGLRLLSQEGPFAVVVSDYRMPGMDGIEFLERVRIGTPKAVRMMLTGQSDAATTIEAVNRGNIFRLLTKPCDPDKLMLGLDAALEQFRVLEAEADYRRNIENQNARYDELLHALFPRSVVTELQRSGRFEPRRHEGVAVLFCDVTDFTPYCERREPEQVVRSLQQLVESFEDICVAEGVEKTKTIGDAFMATAGLLLPVQNPVLNCVRAGLAMIEAARHIDEGWNVRVGVHQGPVVAGVIGRRQYLFDVWGDTVNTASRLEHEGQVGVVTLAESAWQTIAGLVDGHPRGKVMLKGKGEFQLYSVNGLR